MDFSNKQGEHKKVESSASVPSLEPLKFHVKDKQSIETDEEADYSFPYCLFLPHEWSKDFFKPSNLKEKFEKFETSQATEWEELL